MEQYTTPNLLQNPNTIVDYTIGDREFRFYYKWNEYIKRVVVDISLIESDSVTILKTGIVVDINFNIMKFIDPQYFNGSLSLVDVSQNNRTYILENFHTDYTLIYFTEDELNA